MLEARCSVARLDIRQRSLGSTRALGALVSWHSHTFRMLDIGLPESRNALIPAGRIKNCFVQREWLSDPLRESGVVSDIILRERVDKNG